MSDVHETLEQLFHKKGWIFSTTQINWDLQVMIIVNCQRERKNIIIEWDSTMRNSCHSVSNEENKNKKGANKQWTSRFQKLAPWYFHLCKAAKGVCFLIELLHTTAVQRPPIMNLIQTFASANIKCNLGQERQHNKAWLLHAILKKQRSFCNHQTETCDRVEQNMW